jgi:hypothetical protein
MFDDDIVEFCDSRDLLDTAIPEHDGSRGHATAAEAAEAFLDLLRSSADVNSPDLAHLSAAAREQLARDSAPAARLSAPEYSRSQDGRLHYFDNPSDSAGRLDVRVVVQEVEAGGYSVAISYICASQLVTWEAIRAVREEERR